MTCLECLAHNGVTVQDEAILQDTIKTFQGVKYVCTRVGADVTHEIHNNERYSECPYFKERLYDM